MADKKISELTAAITIGDTDVFPIVQAGETKKLSIANFRTNFQIAAQDSIRTETFAFVGKQTLNTTGNINAIDYSVTVLGGVEIFDATLGITSIIDGHIHVVLFRNLTATLISSYGVGWTSITPDSVNASVVLLHTSGVWNILSLYDATVT